jgi:hypothetical protein
MFIADSTSALLSASTNYEAAYPEIRLHKTTNLPVVLYWRETWFLILREEYRLRPPGDKYREMALQVGGWTQV